MFNKRKSSPDASTGVETPRAAEPAYISALQSADKPSIVSEGFTITGELQSNGVLHVEGKVSGTLVAHSVHISPTGEVQGEVTCTALNIKGHLLGNAVCDELIVASSAHVQGSISYKFLSIGVGATVEGDLNHIGA